MKSAIISWKIKYFMPILRVVVRGFLFVCLFVCCLFFVFVFFSLLYYLGLDETIETKKKNNNNSKIRNSFQMSKLTLSSFHFFQTVRIGKGNVKT